MYAKTHPSRRQFLAAAGAALAAGLHHRPADARQLTEADRFESLLGQAFTFAREGRHSTLVLLEVRRHPLLPGDARPAHCRREPFSLLFQSQTKVPLTPASYRLQHPDLGSLTSCLHPVGPQGGRYEVQFN